MAKLEGLLPTKHTWFIANVDEFERSATLSELGGVVRYTHVVKIMSF